MYHLLPSSGRKGFRKKKKNTRQNGYRQQGNADFPWIPKT
jgi:hypothetical protein